MKRMRSPRIDQFVADKYGNRRVRAIGGLLRRFAPLPAPHVPRPDVESVPVAGTSNAALQAADFGIRASTKFATRASRI